MSLLLLQTISYYQMHFCYTALNGYILPFMIHTTASSIIVRFVIQEFFHLFNFRFWVVVINRKSLVIVLPLQPSLSSESKDRTP